MSGLAGVSEEWRVLVVDFLAFGLVFWRSF